ncbi:MAG: hypothetical protein K2X66_10465 [Cyanobacteria bacterium]|nr:hypothetical protein [Cyanobacteriota bacterium]
MKRLIQFQQSLAPWIHCNHSIAKLIVGCLIVILSGVPASLLDESAWALKKNMTLGGRSVDYWEPTVNSLLSSNATHHPSMGSGIKRPLVIFSHGYHGCGTQSKFLTEELANHGYWVFAPNHQDASCGRHQGSFKNRLGPEVSFKKPQSWSDTTYDNRRDDIQNLLADLQKQEPFKSHIDFTRLGLAGHSLGGYTVLGLAGGWPSWKINDNRVKLKAVLALSPYSQPYEIGPHLSEITSPIMFQGGTKDFGITPTLHKSGGTYEQVHAPKYYVEFEGAPHMAWSDRTDAFHQSILAYSLAFLDRYLLNAPGAQEKTKTTLTTKNANVAELWYDSELGKTKTSPRPQLLNQANTPKQGRLRERIRDRILNHRS